MSEYYDHYHRWEPLAEFHFNLEDDDSDCDEENYLYCLCSRAFIRDGVGTYLVDKEDGSESDMEVQRESQSQGWEDQSHVHFSLDTSYKVKCEKDEGASCYCSASHTENCCSTDEHDAAQIHGVSHALQPSDSGADLTYQDCHSDYTNHDKLEKMDQDFPIITEIDENYLSEATWEKYWAIHGERLIWASWIKKYSDYINPAYLDENNDLMMDENNIPKQKSVDQIFCDNNLKYDDDSIRERKFSYDSKVNPYKKSSNHTQNEKQYKNENKDDGWLPIARRRSCSEHERIVSPRTFAGTDSMTNVTKMTLSSYDATSSHVTSESSPTDDYSVSSSTSDDQSNDQTRIANIETVELTGEMDTEQYWQYLWKKHFGEQYAIHYANYIDSHSLNIDLPAINVEVIPQEQKEIKEEEKKDEKVLEIEHENSEGNSQELPTVIEVQAQVEGITLTEKPAPAPRQRKRGKRNTNRYLDSVGVLLQSLLKEEQAKEDNDEKVPNTEIGTDHKPNETEVSEAGDTKETKNDQKERENQSETPVDNNTSTVQPSMGNNNFNAYSYDDGDDDPPEDMPINLKRSHEIDHEEKANEKIKTTFSIMGFCMEENKMPKGAMVYRKKLAKLRPPRYRRFGAPRKTYFDEEGNPVLDQQKDPQEDKEMQTDDDCPDQSELDTQETTKESNINSTDSTPSVTDNKSDNGTNNDTISSNNEALLEAAAMPLPSDLDQSFSEQDNEVKSTDNTAQNTESSKRKRRQKKKKVESDDVSDIPEELRGDPKMIKYWKKRHSLFHRFDEGIRLDRESWFSVTPESVARHVAHKYRARTVLDAFCGAGGNTVQFALAGSKVIAIDIDPVKIELAKHNAAVYGVSDCIEFIVGDFFELAPTLEADMVFLSPPWGGPNYSKNAQYDLETMLEPKPASELMRVARTISSNITLYLPRNSRPDQILTLAKEVSGSVEIEQSYLDKRFIAITAYYY